MKVMVIGSRHDVAGFRLAGIEGHVCTTHREAEEAIARIEKRDEILFLISAECSAAASMSKFALVLGTPRN
jgi:vacuolar-type H+-ATPase subunit F/Vma7